MLSKFFLASHDPADLSSAFKAYQKAVREGVGHVRRQRADVCRSQEAALVHSSSNNPDMYFNRATVPLLIASQMLAGLLANARFRRRDGTWRIIPLPSKTSPKPRLWIHR